MNVACGAALSAGCAGLFRSVSIDEALGFTYDRWQPIETYRSCGFVPSFISLLQDFAIPVPEGYTSEGAQDVYKRQVGP